VAGQIAEHLFVLDFLFLLHQGKRKEEKDNTAGIAVFCRAMLFQIICK
jgi:hypothetical protein